MSNYTKSTNFATKDALPSGDPLKIVKGTEIDTEFNNIATAVATKADLISPTFGGSPTLPTGTTGVTQSAGNNTTALATTAFTTAAITAERTATVTLTNKSLTSPTLTGTPVAPTAAVNNNTTQVATTAFVVAQIADDAPTKTGTGASGTWGIDISGNAATASTVATITSSQVLTAAAAASVGAVGSYAFLGDTGTTGYAPGGTAAGSSLRYAGLRAASSWDNAVPSAGTYGGGTDAPAGTWRCMGNGNASSSSNRATLWLRIS
jgi:hypothetical protein